MNTLLLFLNEHLPRLAARSFVLHPEGVAWSKVAPTAAALMAPTYLGQILPALRATTSAAPRLHSLWTYLMPYLLPGFKPSKGEKGEAGAVPVGGAVAADAMMVEGFWLQVRAWCAACGWLHVVVASGRFGRGWCPVLVTFCAACSQLLLTCQLLLEHSSHACPPQL